MTAIVRAGSGLLAGLAHHAPVLALNLLPWHGQLMVPLATASHRQPTWVQIALNALNCPLTGWVTTTLSAVKIVPPPTGTCDAWPSRVPVIPPAPAVVRPAAAWLPAGLHHAGGLALLIGVVGNRGGTAPGERAADSRQSRSQEHTAPRGGPVLSWPVSHVPSFRLP